MKSLKFCFLLVLGLVYLFNPSSLVAYAYTPCNGSIAECSEENEQLMESEISRRFLAQQKSISYGALRPDHPACDSGAKGQAYSNSGDCLPPPANPPSRGCSKYYRCRSGSWSSKLHGSLYDIMIQASNPYIFCSKCYFLLIQVLI